MESVSKFQTLQFDNFGAKIQINTISAVFSAENKNSCKILTFQRALRILAVWGYVGWIRSFLVQLS